MSPPSRAIRSEMGYTLVELLVAMSLGIIVTTVALSLLNFTTQDVSRISDRVQADQAGRTALEKIMLSLHSACVAPLIDPIRPGSEGSRIKFVSETNPLNEKGEPVSALPTVRIREIIYTPASGKTQGSLIEKSWPLTGKNTQEYKYNESETPRTNMLLKGIKQTEVVEEGIKKILPIFRYYRYYKAGDKEPKFGQLRPNPTTTEPPLTALQQEEVEETAKVTMSFTLVPEGKESTTFGNDRPVALEDSAVLRLEPASEASTGTNEPCDQVP